MGTFSITEEYTFRVTWKIKAPNREDAEKMVFGGCSCIAPKYQTVLKDDIVVDWDGDVHPSKSTVFKEINKELI